jgi:hypothetical protein
MVLAGDAPTPAEEMSEELATPGAPGPAAAGPRRVARVTVKAVSERPGEKRDGTPDVRYAKAQTYALLLSQGRFETEDTVGVVGIVPTDRPEAPRRLRGLREEEILEGVLERGRDAAGEMGAAGLPPPRAARHPGITLQIFPFDRPQALKYLEWALAYWREGGPGRRCGAGDGPADVLGGGGWEFAEGLADGRIHGGEAFGSGGRDHAAILEQGRGRAEKGTSRSFKFA